ncbi:MAG: 30S ribosomal protein S16 [Candidatus Pacebacteria bacterium]|nr:30S ribosomal protein S16 [Candidatus Paceibacterota bacterium]
MLVIRFLRTGKKNQPSFKIVVVEKTRSSTSGQFVEEVGFYNPLTKEKVLKQERIKYWLSVGAQPLETVHNMLVQEKIIEGKKIKIYRKLKKDKEAVPAEAAPEAEVAPVAPAAASVEAAPQPAAPVETNPQPAEQPAVKEEKPAEETPKEPPKTE